MQRLPAVLLRAAGALATLVAAGCGTNGATIAVTNRYPRFDPNPAVKQLVARYAQTVAPLAQRQVGRIAASITRAPAALLENPLGNLIADVQLAATHPREKGGAQLRALLEQQFASGSNSVASPRVLMPSQGFSYAYDLARPRAGASATCGSRTSPSSTPRAIASPRTTFSPLVATTSRFSPRAPMRWAETSTSTHWRPGSPPTARQDCPPPTASAAWRPESALPTLPARQPGAAESGRCCHEMVTYPSSDFDGRLQHGNMTGPCQPKSFFGGSSCAP
jgi:hypothetical protein